MLLGATEARYDVVVDTGDGPRRLAGLGLTFVSEFGADQFLHRVDDALSAQVWPQARALRAARSDVRHRESAAVAWPAAQASRTLNWPLACCLVSTLSLRDSTNARKLVNPSDFSVKAGSIRCIWLFTPAA